MLLGSLKIYSKNYNFDVLPAGFMLQFNKSRPHYRDDYTKTLHFKYTIPIVYITILRSLDIGVHPMSNDKRGFR